MTLRVDREKCDCENTPLEARLRAAELGQSACLGNLDLKTPRKLDQRAIAIDGRISWKRILGLGINTKSVKTLLGSTFRSL
jgi:hypothetical protein